MPTFCLPLSPRKTYLVGLSGGRDSVALLHLLLEHRITNLIICHLNHQLRGHASGQDARFVRRLAQQLGLPLELQSQNVRQLAQRHQLSLETAARQARRHFFAACSQKHHTPHLLLAHHAEDHAETILWNLLRGSSGLRGIEAHTHQTIDGHPLEIQRPLLETRRRDLEAYLQSHKHPYREDQTNHQLDVTRNRLRHQVLPLLADIARRDPIPSLLRATREHQRHRQLLDELLDLQPHLDPQHRLHLPSLRTCSPPHQRALLALFLEKKGHLPPSQALLDRAQLLLTPTGPHSLQVTKDKTLKRRHQRLFFT